MITEITIKNFRCLRDVTVELGKLNVLIGQNGSGKAAFMDAVSLLRTIVSKRVHEYFGSFVFDYDKKYLSNIWENDPDNKVYLSVKTSESQSYSIEFGSRHPYRGVYSPFIINEVFNNNQITDPTNPYSSVSVIKSKNDDDSILLRNLFKGINTTYIEGIHNSKRKEFGYYEEGISNPSILLIDSPEYKLHPHKMKELGSYFKKMKMDLASPQFIITTYSPYLSDQFSPEDVIVFHKVNNETKIKRLCDSKLYKEKSDGFLLGEFWTAFGEESILEE